MGHACWDGLKTCILGEKEADALLLLLFFFLFLGTLFWMSKPKSAFGESREVIVEKERELKGEF